MGYLRTFSGLLKMDRLQTDLSTIPRCNSQLTTRPESPRGDASSMGNRITSIIHTIKCRVLQRHVGSYKRIPPLRVRLSGDRFIFFSPYIGTILAVVTLTSISHYAVESAWLSLAMGNQLICWVLLSTVRLRPGEKIRLEYNICIDL
jgi:hypothetical protein